LRYIGPFLFLLAIPLLFYAIGPVASLGVVAALIAVLLSAEWLVPHAGEDQRSPLSEGRSANGSRVLPLLYTPLQVAVILWSVAVVRALTVAEACAVLFSVGVTAGVFGMIAAHELAHSHNRGHRAIGLALLTALSNRQFRISHLYVHHRLAATGRDPATAQLGETFYAFLLRTVPQQWCEAWRFETRRCARRFLAPLRNRVAQDVAVILILYGAALFAISSIALIVLELFNYIAHYGLLRHLGPDGRQEPLQFRHSWNSSNAISNLMVFNMGRHSDHHRKPSHFYEVLEGISAAPELPAGYAGSILLALVPPLWRRVMDPRVLELRTWTQQSMPIT
jgi:alkane 1-monooxygenase